MAKKSAEKGLIATYAPKLLSFFLSIPEEKRDAFLSKFNNALHFRKFIVRYVTALILVLAALIVILDGLGLLIGYLVPSLMPGITHMAIGALIIAAVIIYIKI